MTEAIEHGPKIVLEVLVATDEVDADGLAVERIHVEVGGEVAAEDEVPELAVGLSVPLRQKYSETTLSHGLRSKRT